MPDHIHIFIGMLPSIALSELVRDIKFLNITPTEFKRIIEIFYKHCTPKGVLEK